MRERDGPEQAGPGHAGPEQAGAAPDERLSLALDGFEGPLDLLLDLARSQKLDLAGISILQLVDQYLAVIEGARRIRLELAAEWLVMAAWLAWLKSRLLLPVAEREPEAMEAGDMLALRLRDLQAIRAAAAWLGGRPLLGIDVFRRGQPEALTVHDRSRLAADLPGLLRALRAAQARSAARIAYVPRPMTVWSMEEALDRLQTMLGRLPPWSSLQSFLPDMQVASAVARRAALASTLLAGLELARTGRLELRQEHAFGPIAVAPHAMSEEA